jgi:hypothetical protein
LREVGVGAEGLRGEVVVLESDGPARGEVVGEGAQCLGRVREVHEDESAHDRVERAVGYGGATVSGCERHVVVAGGLGAGERGPQDLGVLVQADHAARRPDDVGGNQGHVAGPRSDVEDAHAGAETCIVEEASREGVEHFSDHDQSLGLAVVAAHQVDGVVSWVRSMHLGLPGARWLLG